LSNLKDMPVFIQAGRKDNTVPAFLQFVQEKFYKNFGSNVKLDKADYDHVVPTINDDCQEGSDAYYDFKTCGLDAAGNMLRHVLPNLKKNSQAVVARDSDWKG